MTITSAKSLVGVLDWIDTNDHYEGWVSGELNSDNRKLNLRGETGMLVIPNRIWKRTHDMIEPAENFHKKLYQLTALGKVQLLGYHGGK